MDVLKKVPVREQEPAVRAKNFEEVCLGYNEEEAKEEASRCLNCKNAQCMKGCPVAIHIPEFINEVKNGNFAEAYKVIGKSSALPAVCGRVCPQESQCEGKCIRGFKGEPVSIGKLERFVADWARENNVEPEAPAAPWYHFDRCHLFCLTVLDLFFNSFHDYIRYRFCPFPHTITIFFSRIIQQYICLILGIIYTFFKSFVFLKNFIWYYHTNLQLYLLIIFVFSIYHFPFHILHHTTHQYPLYYGLPG